MNVTSCFELLASQETFLLDRREISSSSFTKLRKQIRVIIEALYSSGSDHDMDVAYGLRTNLSEWLTVPVPFDELLTDTLELVGTLDTVERCWGGTDVGCAFKSAIEAAKSLQQTPNPLTESVKGEIEKLFKEEKKFKIYAHRKSVMYFTSLCSNLTEQHFLCAHDDYAGSDPFDVLLKVGPLRSAGWGKCPDALLTSPRFGILTQFVWSGSSDENGFGMDPVTGGSVLDALAGRTGSAANGLCSPLQWSLNSIRVGDTAPDPAYGITDEPVEDDFSFLLKIQKDYANRHQLRSATLIKFVNGHGILVPSKKDVLVYDSARNSIEPVLPIGNHLDGTYFILPVIETPDFGDVSVNNVNYSEIWKKSLSDVIKSHHEELCQWLRMNGVSLLNICTRIRDWCTPPGTVIPAPQKWMHFSALISVLAEHYKKEELQNKDFAKNAWIEIRRSKGKAITEGREEHELQRELEFDLLKRLMPEITSKNRTAYNFTITVPPDKDLQGAYRFFRVESVEQGLVVPDTLLNEINLITEFDIWRG